MVRSLWTVGVLVALLACVGGGATHADEAEDAARDAERAVAALHPFGVRGLPKAFAECARGDERRAAIQAGLAWLTAHQTPDGCWRPDELDWHVGKRVTAGAPTDKGLEMYTVGVTGMTVAAYLGAGHTHRGDGPNDRALRRALTWLVKQQDSDGCIGGRNSQQYLYNHAFATLGLVEAYALTGDRKLQKPAQKALDFSALARNPEMAWRYGIKPGDNDTSVTGCMGMPLYVAGRLNRAGLRAGQIDPLSVDDSAFDGIRRWMDLITDPDYGRAGYVDRGTGPARPADFVDKYPAELSEACTAIAVLMRQLLPAPRATKKEQKASDRLVAKGIGLMLELKPNWQVGRGNIDFYYWYYATMVMRQAGGDAWSAWDPALTGALLEGQHQDGSLADVKGSWPGECVWAKLDGGRIYATAMALLMLETPDRMRPLPDDRSDLIHALAQGIENPSRLASVIRGVGVLRVPGGAAAVAPFVGHKEAAVVAAAAEAFEHLEAGKAGVKALGARLGDERVMVRRAVVRALAAQGKRATPMVSALGARLADEDADVAVGAARALGATGSEEAVALLTPRLEGGPVALRVAAAAALYALTQDKAKTMPLLVQGLTHKRISVRTEAAAALERQSPDIGGAEDALRAALKDDALEVVVHAAGALHRAGKDKDAAILAWVAALEAPRAAVRLSALERLQGTGDARVVTGVRKQLMDGPTTLRVACARVIQSLGEAGRPAAAELSWCCENGPMALRAAATTAYDALAMDAAAAKKHLLDPFEVKDRRVAEGCVRGLVLVGAPVVPHIQATLASGDPTTQAWMLDALRRLGPDAAAAVSDVAKLVELSPESKTRWRAARVLTAIGPAAAPALPALEMALQHEKEYVREAALEAVGALASASDKAVAILLGIASDREKEKRILRATALRSLGGAGKKGVDAFTTLMAGLADAHPPIREASMDALVALYPHVEKLLGKHADAAQVRVRDGIADVARRLGPEAKKLVKPLAKSLEKRSPSGTSRVATALGAIGKPAVSSLTKLLKSDKANVRGEAARALGLIGPDAKRALGALKKLTRDPDWIVQDKAKAAMRQIQAKKR